MMKSHCEVGMPVFFGRTGGEQSLGQVVKMNPMRAQVRLMETRGCKKNYKPGTIWNVPYSLLSVATKRPEEQPKPNPKPPVDTLPKPPVDTLPKLLEALLGTKSLKFSKGDKVKFKAKGVELVGRVTRVNSKTISVKVDGQNGYWRLSPCLLTPA